MHNSNFVGIRWTSIFILSFLAMNACQGQEQARSVERLLHAAQLPEDAWQTAWHRDAFSRDLRDHKKLWVVDAYAAPSFNDQSFCSSTGKVWELVQDSSGGLVTLKSEESDRLIYMIEKRGDSNCDQIDFKKYFSVDEGLPISSINTLLNQLIDTAKCINENRQQCGDWKSVNLPPGLIRNYFLELPHLQVSSVHLVDGMIEVRYRPSKEVPAFLVCTINTLTGSDKNLSVSAGPIETQ